MCTVRVRVKLIIVLVISLACSVVISKRWLLSRKRRLIDGYHMRIKNAAYMVQVIAGGKLCGGALIEFDLVLTAAHCVAMNNPPEVRVIGNTSIFMGRTGVVSAVKQILIPSDYNPFTSYMDVALLELKEPLEGKFVSTIKYAKRDLAQHIGDVRIFGWGQCGAGQQPSDYLLTAAIKLWPQHKCVALLKQYATEDPSAVCGSTYGTQLTCAGDSGGPYVLGDAVVAIHSRFYSDRLKVSIGTTISYSYHWIKSTIKMMSESLSTKF